MVTVGAVWREIQETLEAAGLGPAPREGQALVRRILGWESLQLVTAGESPFPPEKMPELEGLVARRVAGEPLAYVLGVADFWSREWRVGPGVLIPRPDTEVLVAEALVVIPEGVPLRVVEVGVGSGAIVGSILLERPLVTAVGVDISKSALQIAGENWVDAGVSERIKGVESDLLAGVDGPFDMVMSNPPYISNKDYANLEEQVRGYEPELALRSGPDGLEVYRRLIPQAAEKLVSGGWLVLEIGWQQAAGVQELVDKSPWKNVTLHKDLAGRDRVVRLQRG